MNTRKAKQYILLDPKECVPPHKLDLTPGSRDSIKVEYLANQFRQDGFGKKYSALVGYPLNGSIQLLSGTHRHEAAIRTGIKLPVSLYPRAYVEAYWGTDKWKDLIQDINVEDLEEYEVKEDQYPGIGERVDLEFDYDK